jgi:hypothetical protein
MPYCNVLDILVFAANIANGCFQTSWETGLVCFELYPTIVELGGTISLSFMSNSLRATKSTYE